MEQQVGQLDLGPSAWRWDIDLDDMVGLFVHLETRDGSVREGKITGVETVAVVINGERYEIPVSFQLNKDVQDIIEFGQLKQMTLR